LLKFKKNVTFIARRFHEIVFYRHTKYFLRMGGNSEANKKAEEESVKILINKMAEWHKRTSK